MLFESSQILAENFKKLKQCKYWIFSVNNPPFFAKCFNATRIRIKPASWSYRAERDIFYSSAIWPASVYRHLPATERVKSVWTLSYKCSLKSWCPQNHCVLSIHRVPKIIVVFQMSSSTSVLSVLHVSQVLGRATLYLFFLYGFKIILTYLCWVRPPKAMIIMAQRNTRPAAEVCTVCPWTTAQQ